MIDGLELPAEGLCATVAIIGSGAIGRRVAQRLSAAKHKITIYSPSLATTNGSDLEQIRRSKGIALENIDIARTPEEAVQNATHVVIAIDADRVTNNDQKLSQRFFERIPNGARVISVTEFRVFAEGALNILLDRVHQNQLTALLDSHCFDLTCIEDSSANLKAVPAAMLGVGCGEAMDQAALVVLSNAVLKQSFESSLSDFITGGEKCEEVTVIGAGITGLVCALMLARDGYSVIVIDENVRPIVTLEPFSKHISCKGSTLDGYIARQASVTETMPHALPYRKECLKREPLNQGGWQVIDDNVEPKEKAWIDRFIQLACHPELVGNLFTQFVSTINRRGLKFWEDLFEMIPQLEENAVSSRRIIRVCPNAVSLDIVHAYQTKYHDTDDQVIRLSRADVHELLPGLVLADSNAGGVEVPGFSVNVQQLSSNLIDHLEQKEKVTFRWSTQVKTLDDLSSKVVLASEFGRIDSDLVNIVSQVVQDVVGCWIKIPNVHSIDHAFKITENDPMGIMNVIPSVDRQNLFVTGGFGFIGQHKSFHPKRLTQLINIFLNTVRRYLPEEIEARESEPQLPKLYFRPMTPDGMPIVTELKSGNKQKQQVYYVGGSNSGEFVQAPLLATLLIDLMRDQTSNSMLCHVYRSLDINRDTLQLKID
jgi:glycine/D-amino acid oxidase-like deaminating enzyme